MRQSGLVFGADGRRLDEGAGETGSVVRSEWVVHGEHDAIWAQDIEDLAHRLPETLQGSLPTIEELENELGTSSEEESL